MIMIVMMTMIKNNVGKDVKLCSLN